MIHINKEQGTRNKEQKKSNLLSVVCFLLSERNAFTLIELIIAMSIIAILAVAIWGNFFTSINKARDSRRKQDLSQIGKALELYYNDMKTYPTAIPGAGTPFAHPTKTQAVIYMQKIPSDPLSGNPAYCYDSTDGTYYKLYAKLENSEDPNLITPIACPAGGDSYNYGVSSTNTNL